MATFTAVAAATTAAFSIGKSIYDERKASKKQKALEAAYDNYEMPSITNAYAGISVPTSGANLQKEEAIRTQAQLGYNASQMGVSGAGFAGAIADNTRKTMSNIGAQLDESEYKLKTLMASDNQRIQSLYENRAQNDLAALGNQIAYQESKQDASTSRIINTMASATELLDATPLGEKKLWGNKTEADKTT